jgi:putative hydrolase of the HAD superfamily/5'-nucleotidase
VDTCVISGTEGLTKPDRRLFVTAVGRCLDGTSAARPGGAVAAQPSTDACVWVVGDSPAYDIAGGHGCGWPTIWVSHGRTWDTPGFAPTVTAGTPRQALQVLEAQH